MKRNCALFLSLFLALSLFAKPRQCTQFLAEQSPYIFYKEEGELYDAGRIIDMDIEEAAIAVEAPKVCTTNGLGPCVGVAVLDPVKKKAYLFHSSTKDMATVYNLISTAKKAGSDPRDLQVALIGNIDTAGPDGYYPNFPNDVIEVFKDAGVHPDNFATALGRRDGNDGYYNVRVNPSTNRIEYTFVADD